MTIKFIKLLLSASIIFIAFSSSAKENYKCLHIMSYHSGYAWNDGIEYGVEKTLKGHCELKKVFMDTKRNSQPEFAKNKAKKIKLLISSFKPDIVIASDDNASKYIVTQYKDSKIPFVFNGINWTAEPYGFPYKNVTGMVEVAPIMPLLRIIKKNIPKVKNAIYLSADVITEHKDFEHYQRIYKQHGVKLTSKFVKTMQQWIESYKNSQSYDFIIINNHAGINDWDSRVAVSTVAHESKVLTVTNYKWMMPYSMLALTKKAEEQGRWAAEVAIEVLSGTAINSIPITINQEWEFFVNYDLLDKAGIKLDSSSKRSASAVW